MNDSTTDAPTGRSPLMIGGIVAGGVVLLLLLLIPTCRGPSTNNGKQAANGPPSGVSTDQCERLLQSALDGLRPDRLGISSESRVMADTLNNWLTQCLQGQTPAAEDADVQLRQQLLTETAFELTQRERFQEWDAAHIRNSLLAKTIVDNVAGDARSERDRAVELFYFVIRTIELVPDGAIDVPLTPYETLLFGGGTAADRAWTLALLLRQLRLDCVMLQPQAETGEVPYWILAVVLPGDGVYLFDTRLGLPIIAADDGATPLPRQPATLAQVRDDDALLRQFDREGARYPLTAQALKTLDVFAIGTSSTWSPRMELLQAEMSEPVELYDGLGTSRLRESGLIERLVAAGSRGLWTRQQIHVWPYPESRWGNAPQMTDQQQELLAARFRILEGPFDILAQQNEQGEIVPVVQRSQRTLHQARIDQLLGDYAAAQQVYIRTRLKFQNFQQLSLAEVQLNYLAADMAAHWGAQCQYEQDDYQVAAESTQAYLKRRDGQFLLSARYLAGLSLAQVGQAGDAASVLAQLPPQAPQYLGDQMLVDRWRQQAAGNENVETETQAGPSRPANGNVDNPNDADPDAAPAEDSDAQAEDSDTQSDAQQENDVSDEGVSTPPPAPEEDQSADQQSVSVGRERLAAWIG